MFDILSRFALHWVHSFQVEMIRYLIGAAGVALSYWALRRWTTSRRIQQRAATFSDRRREFLLSVQTIAVFGVVDLIAFAGIASGAIPIHRGPFEVAVFAAQLVAMIVLHDAWFYWMHRGLHLKALFLKAHAAHHKSRTPTSWAAYAFAPLEAVFEALYVPILLFGISWISPVYPLAIFVFLGHQIARNAIGHSGHELAWPGFTRSRWTGWLTTTTHHDLHHSEGHNFGLYFTWWDRMMGTEHPRYHERFEAATQPWITGREAERVAGAA